MYLCFKKKYILMLFHVLELINKFVKALVYISNVLKYPQFLFRQLDKNTR